MTRRSRSPTARPTDWRPRYTPMTSTWPSAPRAACAPGLWRTTPPPRRCSRRSAGTGSRGSAARAASRASASSCSTSPSAAHRADDTSGVRLMSSLITLEPEQAALRRMAADLAADRYAPYARAWDEARTPLPDSERRVLADLGLLGITHPAEYGGARPAPLRPRRGLR